MSFYDEQEPSSGSLSDRRRIRAVGFAVLSLFVALFARLYTLQILQHLNYNSLANHNRTRTIVAQAPRGLIVDRNENLLVGNQVVESITVDRATVSKKPGVLSTLATTLGIPLATIQTAFNNPQASPYAPVPVAYNISKQKIIYIKEHPNLFPGVSSSLSTQRVYPETSTASQVLGYVRQISQSELAQYTAQGYQPGDQVGQSGVEASYENYLRGTPGKTTLQVNYAGQVVSTLSKTHPVPGSNVVLTLDLALQKSVEADLAAQIAKLSHTYDPYRRMYFNNLSGAAVVEDVNTGQIVAMASYPTYNPSVWVGNISQAAYDKITLPQYGDPSFNRAIDGLYTPGSTFKLATASAALSSGLISSYYYFNDTGVFNVPNCKPGSGLCSFHNSGGEHLGTINITTAITASDDVFFYNLGYDFYANTTKYGQTPIQNMANAYGFGQPTGIKLPGEAAGLVDSPGLRLLLHKRYPTAYPYDTWYTADQVEMAFGQGETVVSPIQMANAYATFANGGTRYVPQIVAGIVNQNGKVVTKFAPQIATHVTLSPVDRAAMLAGFEGVISNRMGTAYGTFAGFPLSSYPLAGKTGTASVTGYEPNAWFVGFGPLPKPQYAVAVVIEHGGFGTTGAAPVVRSIFDYLRQYTISQPVFGQPHIPAGATTYARYGVSPTTTTSVPGTTVAASPTTATKPG